MPPHDEKVKAEKIEPSELLGIDSPMVIWRTDLERLGLGGGGGSFSGGGSSSSGGNGGDFGGAVEQPPPVQEQYVPMCDAFHHPIEQPGAVEDGRWFGGVFHHYEDARQVAGAHEDGAAYVSVHVDGVLIGPVVQH